MIVNDENMVSTEISKVKNIDIGGNHQNINIDKSLKEIKKI